MKNSAGKAAPLFQHFSRWWRWWAVVLIPLLAVLSVMLAVRVVDSLNYHHNDNDFFTFWLAGHLVSAGGDPYATEQWVNGYHQFEMDIIPNHAFLYPLPLAVLLAPLGLFPFHTAYIIWITLLEWMILAALILMLGASPPHPWRFLIPLLAGLVLFRPTTLTLVQGQMSGLFLFILVLVALLMEKGRWAWSAGLLSLLLLKPNLGLPIIFFLLVWMLSRKKFTSALGLAAGGLVLLIIGSLKNPHWLSDYWGIGSAKLVETFGGSPTIWGLAALMVGTHSPYVIVIGSLATCLLAGGIIWLLMNRRLSLTPLWVISLSVSVTLLITPYTWTYDQLMLLIPIVSATLTLGERRFGFLPAAMLFLGVDILTIFLLFFDTALKVEILNAIIPLVVLGLIIWLLPRKSLSHGEETAPRPG